MWRSNQNNSVEFLRKSHAYLAVHTKLKRCFIVFDDGDCEPVHVIGEDSKTKDELQYAVEAYYEKHYTKNL